MENSYNTLKLHFSCNQGLQSCCKLQSGAQAHSTAAAAAAAWRSFLASKDTDLLVVVEKMDSGGDCDVDDGDDS